MVKIVRAKAPDLSPNVKKADIVASLKRIAAKKLSSGSAPAPITKPVRWSKETVVKPETWYGGTLPALTSHKSSTTDIYGSKESIVFPSKRKPNARPGDGATKTELLSEGDSDIGEKTVLNPLSEEELKRFAEEKVIEVVSCLASRQRETTESQHREVYLLQIKDWIEEQVHAFYRDSAGCEEFLSTRLDEQQAIDDVAKMEAEKLLQKLTDTRNAKFEHFAHACQRWERLMSEKETAVHQLLAEYRAWKPWEVTQFYMNNQIHKLAEQTALQKKEQYERLKGLRLQFAKAKKRWLMEHNRRLNLVEIALRKEATVRAARHVRGKLGTVDEERGKQQLLQEIETWEEIKQRWSDILEERVSRRRNLVYDLDKARLPGAKTVGSASPGIGTYKDAFLSHKQRISTTARALLKEIDDQIRKYNIPINSTVAEPNMTPGEKMDLQDFGL